jgi:hypothetical protein
MTSLGIAHSSPARRPLIAHSSPTRRPLIACSCDEHLMLFTILEANYKGGEIAILTRKEGRIEQILY